MSEYESSLAQTETSALGYKKVNTKRLFTGLYEVLKIVGDKEYTADQAAANDLRSTEEFQYLLRSVKAIDTNYKEPQRPAVWQEERSRRYIARFDEVHTIANSFMP